MRHTAFAVIMMWCVGCSGGEGGSVVKDQATGVGGEGGAVASTSTSSGSSGGGGGGEGGAAPSEDVISIATLGECASPIVIGPAPSEDGQIALGVFVPPRLPWTVESFLFFRDGRLPGCDIELPTEAIYFAGATSTPEESPVVHSVPVPPGEGLVGVVLDPPLVLTEETPVAFAGLRAVVDAGPPARRVCVAACQGSARPELSWWGESPTPPYQWTPLRDSPEPGAGVDADWIFSVHGH